MGYYQEALAVQRHWLGDHHIHVAATVHRIGDLHASQGFLGPAAACYHESLRVYRWLSHHQQLAQQQQPPQSVMDAINVGADIATVLGSLGWIYLLQHDFRNATAVCHEALNRTVQSFGPYHRNIGTIQYQLGWIQWWWGLRSDHYQPKLGTATNTIPCRQALSHWKQTLKQQERFLLLSSSFTNNRHPSPGILDACGGGGLDRRHRRRHVDVAKTLQAMGLAYEASNRYDRAQLAFQAAIEVYQENTPSSEDGGPAQ
jgi:tetratricopeptide (TPR) repeat protein